MKEKLKKLNEYEWILPKGSKPGMNVDGKIIGNKKIIDTMDDGAVEQLANVAMMPGIVNPVLAMPDAHFGYGLPMGAVAAFDAENGVISSGLCGFDINCGVNSIRTNLTFDEIKPRLKELVSALFDAVPCGVGGKGKLKLSANELDEVLIRGVNWAVDKGYGVKDDIGHTEENGCMKGADPKKVSELAKKRGGPQLGTLGAGNHFLEIQKVDEIYNEKLAKKWGIGTKGQILIMLHCGSRGFGHQVATDYLQIQEKAVQKHGIKLPDRQLACAPVNSPEGQDYFSAMKCAVNYSFTNRLVMTQWIRETFEKVFKKEWEAMEMHTVYSIAHNVVKLEEFNGRKLYVHRKGATRAYPDIPALIAGSMGTASYIMVGTEKAVREAFGSTCHGAGRAMSRNEAIRKFRGEKIKQELEARGEVIRGATMEGLAEEAPAAYKDVDDVINSVHNAGISLKVVKVNPLGVLKG